MTNFKDREHAFEAKFARDEEMLFNPVHSGERSRGYLRGIMIAITGKIGNLYRSIRKGSQYHRLNICTCHGHPA